MLIATGGLFELAKAITHCFAELWKLARAEDQQDDDQNDNQMRWL